MARAPPTMRPQARCTLVNSTPLDAATATVPETYRPVSSPSTLAHMSQQSDTPVPQLDTHVPHRAAHSGRAHSQGRTSGPANWGKHMLHHQNPPHPRHCFRTHNNPITMHGAQLSLVVRAWGPDVDAQFRSIPTGANHRIFDDHICGTGSPCDVGGDIGRWQMLNDYICHHGKNSGQSCGTAISINYSPSHPNSCQATCSATFVRVRGNTLKGCLGDSGGPWYDQGYAFGIHGGDGRRRLRCHGQDPVLLGDQGRGERTRGRHLDNWTIHGELVVACA